MFGKNSIAGKSYFKDKPKDTLTITSVFATLQGEGPYSGRRAVFIRLAKCNLACSFCDTYFDEGQEFTFDELYNQAAKTVWDFYAKNDIEPPSLTRLFEGWIFVITGGEPTLQAESLAKFIHEVMDHEYPSNPTLVQIETNGILPFKPLSTDYEVRIIISPKRTEKNSVAGPYVMPHPTTLAEAYAFKFVVSADKESPYHEIPVWAFEHRYNDGIQIYVSPMNVYLKEPQAALELAKSNKDVTIEERSEILERISFWESGLLDPIKNQANHEYAALFAMKHACILTLQTHLLASLP